MAARNANGRFAGSDTRMSSFDLVDALKRLFVTAEKAADFSGAASVARVISSLESNEPPAALEENLVEQATTEERQQLREILFSARVWKECVRERLSREKRHVL